MCKKTPSRVDSQKKTNIIPYYMSSMLRKPSKNSDQPAHPQVPAVVSDLVLHCLFRHVCQFHHLFMSLKNLKSSGLSGKQCRPCSHYAAFDLGNAASDLGLHC